MRDEEVDLSKEEIERRKVCLGECWKISRRHESFLHQKSRVTEWPRLFHGMINWRKGQNGLKRLQMEG